MEDPPPSATWHPALRPETLDDASLYSPNPDGPRLVTLSWDDVVAGTSARSRAPTHNLQDTQQAAPTIIEEETSISKGRPSSHSLSVGSPVKKSLDGLNDEHQELDIENTRQMNTLVDGPRFPSEAKTNNEDNKQHDEVLSSKRLETQLVHSDKRAEEEDTDPLATGLTAPYKSTSEDLFEETLKPSGLDSTQPKLASENQTPADFFSSSDGQEATYEDVDAAWGNVGMQNHTNSFPPVPFPDFEQTSLQPLAHSQAAALIQEEQETEFQGSHHDKQADSTDPWSIAGDKLADDGGFFSQSERQEQEPFTPPNEEARFEEGIPLISQDRSSTMHNPFIDETENVWNDDPASGGDDFFSGINTGTLNSTSQPPTLARKSTQQVLDAIRSHDPVSHPYEVNDDENADKLLDGSSLKEIPTEAPPASTEVSAKAGENLAALWEEALGDDLLDDSVDPSSFFGNEDDGFLLEDENASVDELAALPPGDYPPQQSSHNYYNQAFTPMTTSYVPAGFDPVAFKRGQSPFQTQPLKAPIEEPAESFAAKSKGGYSSPYDAPMDLSRPRRTPAARAPQVLTRTGSAAPPPPRRTDSVQSGYAPSPTLLGPPPSTPTYTASTEPYQAASAPFQAPSTSIQAASSTPKVNSAGFFEELPITAKPRAFTPTSRFIPQMTPPQQIPPSIAPYQQPQYVSHVPPTHQQHSLQQQPPPRPAAPNDYGLVGPAKVMPFSDSASPVVALPTQPTAQSSAGGRYSPSSLQQTGQHMAQPASNQGPRTVPPNPYATSNVAQGIARPPSAPHQHIPHKPSPLSRSSSANQYRPGEQPLDTSSTETSQTLGGRRPSMLRNTQTSDAKPLANMISETNQLGISVTHRNVEQVTNPAVSTREPGQSYESSKQLPSLPVHQEVETPKLRPIVPRLPPNSLEQIRHAESYSASQQKVLTAANRVRAPSLTGDNNFMPPSDASAQDPLKRWQGAPIFHFGFGGTVITSFPARIPRYTTGSRTPLIKCNPGELRIHSAKILPPNERVATFPGPLKNKNKKKDVLLWLHNGIASLAQAHPEVAGQSLGSDDQKRHEEKIMLWKVLAALVEHDGILEGNAQALDAIRKTLSPEASTHKDQETITQPLLPAISSPEAFFKPSITASSSIDTLRQLLLNGDRTKAVWHAVDQRLWGHAMLIASTMPRDLWKQVAHEFVRNEVKPASRNTESLAALYDVFAGNGEEIVDELVPPSARAGLTLMSKNPTADFVSSGLDGLNRWRETLNLILSNRTMDDTKAVVAMAQLLANYGRFEAAHICYVLAKVPGLFGGLDDSQTAVVLLGTDHRQLPLDYAYDLDSILLTEVFEFINSTLVAVPSQTFTLPHLQPFKLYHAEILVELGLREEAQQYCDSIVTAQKTNTNRSPHYHSHLISAVDGLSLRLRQSGKDSSGSWISRPNVDKMSGSFFKALSGFIAGDNDEAAATSTKADTEGPFARINGNTPEMISRNASPAPGYGSHVTTQGYALQNPAAMAAVNSRYAPTAVILANSPQGTAITQRSMPSDNTHNPLPPGQADIYSSYPTTQFSHTARLANALATAPTATNISSEASKHQFSNPTPPVLSNSRSSPPVSDTGSLPSSIDHETRPSHLLLSPETKGSPHQAFSPLSKNRYSPAPSHSPGSASLGPSGSSYEPMSATYQPRSYAPSPSLEPVQSTHVDSYQPTIPTYGQSSSDGLPDMYNNSYTDSVEKTPQNVESSEQIGSDQPLDDTSTPAGPDQPFNGGYQPPSAGYAPPSAGYEPPSAGYEPPSYGYEPPSYGTAEAEDQGEAKSPRKKKSFMDDNDDDDLASRAAALKKASKGKDREVDDAFRRAAEEDAKKDKEPKSGGGWFGSIWGKGGSKESKQPETKAAQIKFGEENSFYYDKELKQWVNKKAGVEAATRAAPTPPPPKGPPSRAVSAAHGPPMSTSQPTSHPLNGVPGGNVSRTLTPETGAPSTTGPPPPTGLAAGLIPPSRPSTGMSGTSNASSVDDLMGPAQPRKGGTIKKGKKRTGYVDILANKS